MKKSGLADSPFFASPTNKAEAATPLHAIPPVEQEEEKANIRDSEEQATTMPSNHATTEPPYHDTVVSRHHDTTVSWYSDALVEQVRKAVKEFGKEAATHRFTLAEKRAIADLIYTYGNKGIRTSENEIARVAINFIVEDLKENAGNSILERVLKALNE